jgi:hypothetical protein
MKKKKRNPQDATLRNVRAAKRRDAALMARLARIESHLVVIVSRLADIAAGRRFA